MPGFLAGGLPAHSSLSLPLAIGAAGFCAGSANAGIAAIVGMLYPASIESLGSGWSEAFGRVGAISAQVAGGFLLARRVPVEGIFVVPAVVVGLAAAATFMLTLRAYRLFGSFTLHEVT